MKKKKFINQLMKNNRASWIPIVGMIVISLLSASCTSEYNKQALPEKGESEIGKSGGDREIECRWEIPTGSTLREKVCRTKAGWAEIDRRQKMDADKFYDEVVDEMRQNRTEFESNR